MSTSAASDLVNARELVLHNPHVTGEELRTELANATPANLARMRANGNIIGLRFARRGYIYPAFQFDNARQRVHPVVTQVNRALLVGRRVDSAIAWWFTPHSLLGKAPHLGVERTDALLGAVAAAARATLD